MTMFRHLLPLSLILGLSACAVAMEEEVVVPVEAEPISGAPDIGREEDACEPGTDDGIGGTGCSVD